MRRALRRLRKWVPEVRSAETKKRSLNQAVRGAPC